MTQTLPTQTLSTTPTTLSRDDLIASLETHLSSHAILTPENAEVLTPAAFRELFMLEPDTTFLNHGSFGATPKPVFEIYQAWQRYLERQPVRFFRDELTNYLQQARTSLAVYLGCDPLDVVFVPNATVGVNAAVHALPLKAGDEVLSSDQEYGACDNAWRHWAEKRGFSYVKASLPLPFESEDAVLEQFWSHVTQQTRVIFLSHITSATAQTLPIAKICERAREHNILTIIDGAHAPGQVVLELDALGADIYTGNCHKWLISPKGAGFLYVRRDKQDLIDPPIVGWRRLGRTSLGSRFQDDFEFFGTNDYSAYLSVPAAITFQAKHAWGDVQSRCHQLLRDVMMQWQDASQTTPAYTSNDMFQQMAILEVPAVDDLAAFQVDFLRKHAVEVPFTQHLTKTFARVSVQAYNDETNIARLFDALQKVF